MLTTLEFQYFHMEIACSPQSSPNTENADKDPATSTVFEVIELESNGQPSAQRATPTG